MALLAIFALLLTGGDVLVLRVARCEVLLQPVPGPNGDSYAVKWVCQ